jgi:hypothetical protein
MCEFPGGLRCEGYKYRHDAEGSYIPGSKGAGERCSVTSLSPVENAEPLREGQRYCLAHGGTSAHAPTSSRVKTVHYSKFCVKGQLPSKPLALQVDSLAEQDPSPVARYIICLASDSEDDDELFAGSDADEE